MNYEIKILTLAKDKKYEKAIFFRSNNYVC